MEGQAFVICQVGDEGTPVRSRADEVYDLVVTPIVEEFGLTVQRSDRDPTPGQITSQIIRSLTSAKVVIADLTGRNPNVYYELGVAHSFGMPVVVLADSAESLSFDTSNERVIPLGTDERLGAAEAETAKARLKEALGVVLSDGYHPSSVVTEAAGARSLQDLAPDNPVAQELSTLSERVEVLIRQHGGADEQPFRRDMQQMLDFMSELISKGRIGKSDLDDFAERHRLSNDTQKALGNIAPPPRRPQASAQTSDDDIPF